MKIFPCYVRILRVDRGSTIQENARGLIVMKEGTSMKTGRKVWRDCRAHDTERGEGGRKDGEECAETGDEPGRKAESDRQREKKIWRMNANRSGSDRRKKRNSGSGRLLQLQLALR